jgi:hypothetical protein
MTANITSLQFFSRLCWLDGKPLLDTIEPYRRELFTKALDTFREDGVPVYNLVVSGRGKKNWKTADLILAGLYKLLVPVSAQGNDGFVLANDEGQAADDLTLAKKLVVCNPDLATALEPLAKELKRKDGAGSLKILPARDIAGAHGKTASFVGFDEIHGYRSWDLFEALAPDPTRADALQWVTSYDTIWSAPGIPLYDLKVAGKAGTDPRMLFSWYSGDYTTDPAFAELPPEQRANPSMASWPEGMAYLEQQRRRLPTHKYRRLHLNLPGSPSGAFFEQGSVLTAIVPGRRTLPAVPGRKEWAFVDMSGGSSDDAVLSCGYEEGGRAIVSLVMKQAGGVPFNPREAVARFAAVLRERHISSVTGDAYAGQTFRQDFEERGISYRVSSLSKTELYENLEPALNAGEVELPDEPRLQEQLLTLVIRGAKVDHQPGDHDDWANAAAGVVWVIRDALRSVQFEPQIGAASVYSDSSSSIDEHRAARNIKPVPTPAPTMSALDSKRRGNLFGDGGMGTGAMRGSRANPSSAPHLDSGAWEQTTR